MALCVRHGLGGVVVRHARDISAGAGGHARVSVRRGRHVRAHSRAPGLGLRLPRGPHGGALRAARRALRLRALPQRRPLCGRRGVVGVRVRAGLGGGHLHCAGRTSARHVHARVPACRSLRT